MQRFVPEAASRNRYPVGYSLFTKPDILYHLGPLHSMTCIMLTAMRRLRSKVDLTICTFAVPSLQWKPHEAVDADSATTDEHRGTQISLCPSMLVGLLLQLAMQAMVSWLGGRTSQC